jgi:U3 small nucleolar ribonucleoprotein protein IMP3
MCVLVLKKYRYLRSQYSIFVEMTKGSGGVPSAAKFTSSQAPSQAAPMSAKREGPSVADHKKRPLLAKDAPSSGDRENPIHRRLKYHEKKMLRQHDFMQYPQDLWHEPFCVAKYHLTDREDYRRYMKLVGLIRALMTQLRHLPATSKIRVEITDQLLRKLHDMSLIQERLGLAEVDKVGVEAFCKRRLPAVLVRMRMAGNCKLASDMIEHGHVRVGVNQVRDPAFLVPRGLDDTVTWMDQSKIRQHVKAFHNEKDDFDVLGS